MFIVKDVLEQDRDVKVCEEVSSSWYKLLAWPNCLKQLSCQVDGNSITAYAPIAWCGGEVSMGFTDKCATIHGSGTVLFVRQADEVISLDLAMCGGSVLLRKESLMAVPSECVVSPDEGVLGAPGFVTVSGAVKIPITVKLPEKELVVVTLSEDDALVVGVEQVLYYSTSLHVEQKKEANGLVCFSGDGSIGFWNT